MLFNMFIFAVCPVKCATNMVLYDHIRDNHAEEQIPGVLFFDSVAGKSTIETEIHDFTFI